MARLEYAILSEFAKVDQAGLLTIVAGGFRGVDVHDASAVMPLQLAAEISFDPSEDSTDLHVRVQDASGDFTADLRTTIDVPKDAPAVDDRITVPLALVVPPIPLAVPGVYRVITTIADSDDPAKVLSFVVNHITHEHDG